MFLDFATSEEIWDNQSLYHSKPIKDLVWILIEQTGLPKKKNVWDNQI